MHQFVVKDRGVLIARGMAALPPPSCDGGGDPADQLTNAGFSLRTAFFPMEIFGSDDVRGRHGPGLRDFDILLLEDNGAGFVGNRGSSVLPLDRFVRRYAFTSKMPPEFQPLLGLAKAHSFLDLRFQNFLFHALLPPYIVLIWTTYARYRGSGTG